MGSSFLTTINVGLSLYSIILCLKSIIQFGLPNHPARFLLYLVCFSVAGFFTLRALANFEQILPHEFIRFRTLPMVAGSLALFFQIITAIGNFSLLQLKIISRIPLMAALLVFAFFSSEADIFFAVCILACVLFFSVSVRKARYQKRIFLKMAFFLSLSGLTILVNQYWAYVLGQLFLFPSLFYFFIFEQTFGVTGIIEKFQAENSGAPS